MQTSNYSPIEQRKLHQLNPIYFILILFVLSRLALTLIGVISRTELGHLGIKEKYSPILSEHTALDIWGVWDSNWYLGIAEKGYSATKSTSQETVGQANYVFFPLYPMLVKAISAVVGNFFYSGIILSNLCFVLASYFLYKLIKLEYNEETALNTVKYLFFYPVAFIFSGVFTESLFLLLTVLTLYFAKKDQFLYAGIAGFLAALTRNLGVFIVIIVFLELIAKHRHSIKKIISKLPALTLIPIGLGLFMLFLYFLTGNPLAFVANQASRNRGFANPLTTLLNGLISHNIDEWFSAYFTVATISITLISLKFIRFKYTLWSFLLIFFPLLLGKVESMPRYSLVAFPLMLTLARITTKNKYLDSAISAALLLIQGGLMVFWVNGYLLVI